MPTPPNAIALTQPMDPSDLIDYSLTLSQGDDAKSLLATGESVASYTLELTTEAMAAGLQIQSGNGYDTTLSGLSLKFWLAVDPAVTSNATFDGAGLTLGIELTVITDAPTPRRRQRTITVQVANQ